MDTETSDISFSEEMRLLDPKICWEASPDGGHVCILHADHSGEHGWERDTKHDLESHVLDVVAMAMALFVIRYPSMAMQGQKPDENSYLYASFILEALDVAGFEIVAKDRGDSDEPSPDTMEPSTDEGQGIS